MFRTRIEEMEKEMATLRKSVGSNPAPKALTQSTNARQRKEKIINCENVQVMEKLAETGTELSKRTRYNFGFTHLTCRAQAVPPPPSSPAMSTAGIAR